MKVFSFVSLLFFGGSKSTANTSNGHYVKDENTLKTLQQGRQIQSQTVYEQHGYITSQLAKLHEIEAGLKNYYVDKKGVIFSFSRISSF